MEKCDAELTPCGTENEVRIFMSADLSPAQMARHRQRSSRIHFTTV